MLFDAYAALRKLEAEPEPPATLATTATLPVKIPPVVAGVAVVATSQSRKPGKQHCTDAPSPYRQTVGGRHRSWTGKVVSLADWRNLSEWERRGATGKMGNGLTQQWEAKP